jgi:hypothetical protein
VAALRRRLAAESDYELLAADPACARLRFLGRFEGRAVAWDATVRALGAGAARRYIDIGADGPDGVRLEVGLPLEALDAPALRKCVIMIRQYRRLRRGRHEFGGAARPARIVSGGQTGVDRAALDAALALGIACGGWCPKGRRAEDGRIPDRYTLDETATDAYEERTERNVRFADATVVFTYGEPAGGSALTLEFARAHGKPSLHLDLGKTTPEQAGARLRAWIAKEGVSILNVAGSRESNAPGIQKLVWRIVKAAFREA